MGETNESYSLGLSVGGYYACCEFDEDVDVDEFLEGIRDALIDEGYEID